MNRRQALKTLGAIGLGASLPPAAAGGVKTGWSRPFVLTCGEHTLVFPPDKRVPFPVELPPPFPSSFRDDLDSVIRTIRPGDSWYAAAARTFPDHNMCRQEGHTHLDILAVGDEYALPLSKFEHETYFWRLTDEPGPPGDPIHTVHTAFYHHDGNRYIAHQQHSSIRGNPPAYFFRLWRVNNPKDKS